MSKNLAILLGCATLAGPPAHAQLRVGLGIGALMATDLVRDSIVEPISVRQNIAVVLGFTVDGSLDARTRVGISLSAVRTDMVAQFDTASATLTTLTTWSPALAVSRSLSSSVAISVKGLLIAYRPRFTAGTPFRDDKPLRPAAGLGLHLSRRAGTRFTIGADLSYDVHGFTTRALRGDGIDQRLVHRITIGASIRRWYGEIRS